MATQTITKTTWHVDPSHSEIGFKVRHMMITNVSGSFEKFDVHVETEENDFETASINFSADIQSISTGNADRDNHLRSADFFDAVIHPNLKFVSAGLSKKDDGNFIMEGDLTIRDV
ncbi:MAG TPA: YceI family protein, partial [Chryseosolibacter sp.]|nr:YceI family protein [Chryseosolibacter sp.]